MRRGKGGEQSPGRAENCFSYFIKSAVHFSSSARAGEGGREEEDETQAASWWCVALDGGWYEY